MLIWLPIVIPANLDGSWRIEVSHLILKMDKPNITSVQIGTIGLNRIEMKTLPKKSQNISHVRKYIF